jgi:hypothetical protein
MTREEIEQKMDELARKYVETHDKKIDGIGLPWDAHSVLTGQRRLNSSFEMLMSVLSS